MNRPEKKNAMNEELYAQLAEAVYDYMDDEQLRCAVLSGAGDNFSSGGDLKWLDERHSSKVKNLMTSSL